MMFLPFLIQLVVCGIGATIWWPDQDDAGPDQQAEEVEIGRVSYQIRRNLIDLTHPLQRSADISYEPQKAWQFYDNGELITVIYTMAIYYPQTYQHTYPREKVRQAWDLQLSAYNSRSTHLGGSGWIQVRSPYGAGSDRTKYWGTKDEIFVTRNNIRLKNENGGEIRFSF